MDKAKVSSRSQPGAPHDSACLSVWEQNSVNQLCPRLLCSPTSSFSASGCLICEMGECTEARGNVALPHTAKMQKEPVLFLCGGSRWKGRLQTS